MCWIKRHKGWNSQTHCMVLEWISVETEQLIVKNILG